MGAAFSCTFFDIGFYFQSYKIHLYYRDGFLCCGLTFMAILVNAVILVGDQCILHSLLLFCHLRVRSLHLFLFHLFALGTDALQELICKWEAAILQQLLDADLSRLPDL